MSDEIDIAQIRELEDTQRAIAAARSTVGSYIVGDPGECEWCGEVVERVVGGACAPCRDKYKLD